MRKCSKVASMVAVVVFLFSMVASMPTTSAAASVPAQLFPPDSAPYGRTYADWMASWQQWAIGIPVSVHPLFDNGDAATGQSGPVFFLGGKFCALGVTGCGTNNVVRNITVPAGKALFFPIVDAEVSTVETGLGNPNSPKAVQDINTLRQIAQSYVDYTTVAILEVDGVSIPLDNFRFQSTAFGFYLPRDDEFTALGEGKFTPGYYFPGVDDGYYVMLHPLSAGKQHTIHFRAEQPAWNWVLDITYFVDVQK